MAYNVCMWRYIQIRNCTQLLIKNGSREEIWDLVEYSCERLVKITGCRANRFVRYSHTGSWTTLKTWMNAPEGASLILDYGKYMTYVRERKIIRDEYIRDVVMMERNVKMVDYRPTETIPEDWYAR